MTDPPGRVAPAPTLRVVREASRDELASWDARAVAVPGGDVQQSLAWARHRERTGWQAHHLVLDDDSVALLLGRRWTIVGGGRAYVPKGPVAAGDSPELVAARLVAVAGWARRAGYDVILADPEVAAGSRYGALIRAAGFRPAEEVGPSRHRVGVPIAEGADDRDLLAGVARGTRQRFQAAERKGTRIVRFDRGPGGAMAGLEAPPPDRLAAAAAEAFGRFHALLVETGTRRGFEIRDRAVALAWWRAALEAGHLVLLEARAADDAYLGGAIFYRHGERLSYAHSGDVVGLRHLHPGTVHLVLWRALQMAAREGRRELDLGGVDVRGARREPGPGEPMYGLLEFKRSFGGRWIELAGAHERVLRPGRHSLATATRGASQAGRAMLARLTSRRGGEA
jgi:lipid II:glycine glycyltransferase (peptidoglycan interpeptide bridge formation enzyme)